MGQWVLLKVLAGPIGKYIPAYTYNFLEELEVRQFVCMTRMVYRSRFGSCFVAPARHMTLRCFVGFFRVSESPMVKKQEEVFERDQRFHGFHLLALISPNGEIKKYRNMHGKSTHQLFLIDPVRLK